MSYCLYLVFCLKVFTRRDYESALRASAARPVNVACYHDGTPSYAWRRVFRACPNEDDLIREAGRGLEAYIVRAYVYTGGADPSVVPLVVPAVPMNQHGALDIFPVLDSVLPLPVLTKRSGICLMSYHSDRGNKNSINRLLFQRQAEWEATLPNDEGALRTYSAWPLVIQCLLHDSHGAFLDSLEEAASICRTPVKEITKAMFKTVRALREAYDQFLDVIDEWVIQHISWSEEDFDHHEVLEFWRQLGVSDGLAQALAERNLRWVNGRLEAHVRFRSSDTPHGDLVSLVIGVYRFVRFVGWRFMGAGKTFSALMAANYIGLDSMVAKIYATEGQGTWYLSGYSSFSTACR